MLIYKFSKIILKNILMRILNPGRDSKTQNYEMCNPNINICYKFTRTQLHKLFSHFVSSINQTIKIESYII